MIMIFSLSILNACLSLNARAQEDDSESEKDSNLNLCNFDHIKKFYGNGTLVASWGKKGTGDGKFLHPHAIAVDSRGNVYVTDEKRLDVQKFDKKGDFI